MSKCKFLLGLMLLIGLSACTDSSMAPDNDVQNGKELEKIVFNFPDLEFDSSQTRASYLEGSNGLTLRWSTADTIGIFSQIGSQVAFPMLKGTGGSNTAIFDGNGWGLLEGKSYFAYYPYNYYNRSVDNLQLDFSNQNQYSMVNPTSGHWGLCEHDFMYSGLTNPIGNTLTINLNRLGSIVRVDVDLSELGEGDISPSGLVIEEAELISQNTSFPLEVMFNVEKTGYTYVPKSGKTIKLNILQPAVQEGNTASFYFSIWDTRTESENYKLTFKAAGGYKYVVPLGEVESRFLPGKVIRGMSRGCGLMTIRAWSGLLSFVLARS